MSSIITDNIEVYIKKLVNAELGSKEKRSAKGKEEKLKSADKDSLKKTDNAVNHSD